MTDLPTGSEWTAAKTAESVAALLNQSVTAQTAERREQMRREILAGHPANAEHGKVKHMAPSGPPVSLTSTCAPEMWQHDPITHRLIFPELEESRQTAKNPLCRDYPRTDLGNSQRFVLRHGLNCRYIPSFKSWFVWDGSRWQRDDLGLVRELAKDTATRIYDEAGMAAGNVEQTELYKWAIGSQARSKIDAMIDLAKSALAISPDELDTNPDQINLQNGTLDLRTFEFLAARRNDLITKITGCAYNPAATCPTWDCFLNQIMDGNKNLIGFLQRAAGYSLTGHTGERMIFLCHGTGANGKSTFLNTLLAVLGEYGLSVESGTFCVSRNEGVRNDLAALKGARFVSATEAGKGKRLDESLIKQLSGGSDKIRARFLFQEYFEFRPSCKIFWAFNSAPRITDSTESIWARVKMIPFSVVIPEAERDTRLLEKLLKESAGIVNWMIAGLREYQRIGLAEPAEVHDATQQYREDQDLLADFLKDNCVIEPTAKCGATDLYNAYTQWHSWQAPDEKVKPQRSFGFEMSDHGFKRDKDRDTKLRIYLGIRLKKVGE